MWSSCYCIVLETMTRDSGQVQYWCNLISQRFSLYSLSRPQRQKLQILGPIHVNCTMPGCLYCMTFSRSNRKYLAYTQSQTWRLMPAMPMLKRQTQEDCCDCQVSLNCVVSSRPAWATVWNLISKQNGRVAKLRTNAGDEEYHAVRRAWGRMG